MAGQDEEEFGETFFFHCHEDARPEEKLVLKRAASVFEEMLATCSFPGETFPSRSHNSTVPDNLLDLSISQSGGNASKLQEQNFMGPNPCLVDLNSAFLTNTAEISEGEHLKSLKSLMDFDCTADRNIRQPLLEEEKEEEDDSDKLIATISILSEVLLSHQSTANKNSPSSMKNKAELENSLFNLSKCLLQRHHHHHHHQTKNARTDNRTESAGDSVQGYHTVTKVTDAEEEEEEEEVEKEKSYYDSDEVKQRLALLNARNQNNEELIKDNYISTSSSSSSENILLREWERV